MNNARLVRVATYFSVLVALFLLVLKSYAWWHTGAVSILASLLDSAIDIAASVMILVAVHIAQTPPDKEHRFGHGNAEPLASLAQSIFIAGSAIYLLVFSFDRLLTSQPIAMPTLGLNVMFISLALTLVLISFQRYVIRKTQSTAIQADSLHYLTDLLANLLVIVSLWLSHLYWLDPVVGLLIATWILYAAVRIAINSGNQLLDHELPESMRQTIRQITLNTPQVEGMNDLRTYQSGPIKFVQFDLELDDNLTLLESHAITEEVTQRLKAKYDDLDVMIHQEPVSFRNDPAHHSWGKH